METGDYSAHKCARARVEPRDDVIVEVSATLLFWKRRERRERRGGSPLSQSLTHSFIPTWNKGITRAVWAEFVALAPNLTDGGEKFAVDRNRNRHKEGREQNGVVLII